MATIYLIISALLGMGQCWIDNGNTMPTIHQCTMF